MLIHPCWQAELRNNRKRKAKDIKLVETSNNRMLPVRSATIEGQNALLQPCASRIGVTWWMLKTRVNKLRVTECPNCALWKLKRRWLYMSKPTRFPFKSATRSALKALGYLTSFFAMPNNGRWEQYTIDLIVYLFGDEIDQHLGWKRGCLSNRPSTNLVYRSGRRAVYSWVNEKHDVQSCPRRR